VCSCGFSSAEKIELKESIPHKEIEVIDENFSYGESTIPVVCWNCGHTGVYVKVNFHRSDEAPLRIYKCEKCRKVWRSSK
jgi:DNA-directed RNA polymerase subunit M/transcription elongation factor TFIIS